MNEAAYACAQIINARVFVLKPTLFSSPPSPSAYVQSSRHTRRFPTAEDVSTRVQLFEYFRLKQHTALRQPQTAAKVDFSDWIFYHLQSFAPLRKTAWSHILMLSYPGYLFRPCKDSTAVSRTFLLSPCKHPYLRCFGKSCTRRRDVGSPQRQSTTRTMSYNGIDL